jgi:peptidoglycan/LPS O-acetylase OafA/YrhL
VNAAASSSALPPSLARPDHLPSLDGLRGLAIVLVLLHNLDVLAPAPGHGLGVGLIKEGLYLGWIGVQLFFVLSGYLITRGLLASRDQPGWLRDFLVKRGLRILPLYWIALLLFTVVLPALGLPLPHASHFSALWLWLHLSNWTSPFEPDGGPLPHTWSLSVEEQFYLLWPLLLRRLDLREIWLLALALIGISPLLRLMMLNLGLPAEALYTFTISRIDALAAGAALATWDRGRALEGATRWRSAHLARLSIALLVLTALASNGFQRLGAVAQIGGYSLLTLSCTAVLAWAVLCDRARARGALQGPASRLLRLPVLASFGQYSYAIYLVHKPLHDLVGLPLLRRLLGADHTADPMQALLYLVAASAVCWLIGALSWRLIERPALALRARWLTPR